MNSVALHAENLLPPEAYGPIPDDAAAGGMSNVPRTELFVGRGRELDALDVAFTNPGGVVLRAVSGLGGVGKSALAARWAENRATARLRWWITADSVAHVDAGLAELARALQPGLAALPLELQRERAVAWLAGHSDWLVVLDNVDHPDHIRPLLDRLAEGGRVLITTRRAKGWHRLASPLRLDVLDESESVELYTRVLTHDGPRESDGAAELCAELGHLALAVEQAAAYCHETGTTPPEYLDMLRQWPAAMFIAGPEGADAERSVARIWRLTLDRLAEVPLAGQVLRILAWYASDHIPRTVLEGLASPPELATAIGRLLAYSMVSENPDGSLSVHRLVQTLARTPQKEDPHRREVDISAARQQATIHLKKAFPEDVTSPAQWPQCRKLLPHVDALAHHNAPEHDTVDTAHLLSQAAYVQQLEGAWSSALTYFLRALATIQRIVGKDESDTLAARSNLAGAYRDAGDLAQAIRLYEQNVVDGDRILGNDHPVTRLSRNNLAVAYRAAGYLAQAISLHEQTRDSYERAFGNDHPHTLICRTNLATAYGAAGDLAKAVRLHEQNLADWERIVGTDHPHTLMARDNLATAYKDAGDLVKAVRLFEQNLADWERIVGNDRPDTLIARNNLAVAYSNAGDFVKGVRLLKQNLAYREGTVGSDHPHTLTARHNLAAAYRDAGNLPRAIRLHEQNLADWERIVGTERLDTLIARNNLAMVHTQAGDPARAIPLYERTLADCERVLGRDHPLYNTVRTNLDAALTR